MQTENLISVDIFCANHDIEISFLSSLHQNGLIEITNIRETAYIDKSQLEHLEKYIRFYYDLDINLEGIEAIIHLIDRVKTMQDELIALSNRLRLYEK
jgi:chaperone modulatory protein CbpM